MDSKEKLCRYQIERYRRFREEKRCPQCGKQDERTLNGKCYCEKCMDNRRKKCRRQYRNRQQNHECTRCGVKLPNDYFYVKCDNCRNREQEKCREKKKTAGAATPNGQKQ